MSNQHPGFKQLFASPVNFLALGFGSGLAPRAPGTFGTLAAVPIYLVLVWLDNETVYLSIMLLIVVAGIWICERSAQLLGVHDHPAIVWDEIAGYLVTMAFVPWSLTNMIAGFCLFRLFDIWKPWPICIIDKKLKGGLGIMLDDVLAALYAALFLSWFGFSP